MSVRAMSAAGAAALAGRRFFRLLLAFMGRLGGYDAFPNFLGNQSGKISHEWSQISNLSCPVTAIM
jgi:hypothetical protein